MYLEKIYQTILEFMLAIGIFGVVLGLWELHRRKRKTQNP